MHSDIALQVAAAHQFPAPVSDAKTWPAGRFRPNRENPRRHRDPAVLSDMRTSIAATGVHSPVMARVINDDPDYDFAIVYGDTRLLLALEAHGPMYPLPYVLTSLDHVQAAAVALVENVQRGAMALGDTAYEAKRLLSLMNGDKAETARLLGWSRRTLDARLCLTACSTDVLDALAIGAIELGHAELLSGLPPDVQATVLQSILAAHPSVAELKRQLGGYARALSAAMFDTAQCAGCRHNSAQQANLFNESLGEGFCQAPAHFDELTRAVLEQRSKELAETYRVVRIVEVKDGFTPLRVGAEDVGAEQYTQCRQCAQFGCAVSNLPGSQGKIAESLCFDTQCNDRMRRAHRRNLRARDVHADSSGMAEGATAHGKRGGRAPGSVAPRVAEYRLACWRTWAARALAETDANADRTPLLLALLLSGHGHRFDPGRLDNAVGSIVGAGADFTAALAWANNADRRALGTAAAGIATNIIATLAEPALVAVLTHLDVQEGRYYTLGPDLLNLLTKSELDGLAAELALDANLDGRYGDARACDKAALVQALLSIDGQEYRGLVPGIMRYPRPATADTAFLSCDRARPVTAPAPGPTS